MFKKARMWLVLVCLIFSTILGSSIIIAQDSVEGPVAKMVIESGKIIWQPYNQEESMTLTVSGPDGIFKADFVAGEDAFFSLLSTDSKGIADGYYTYELVTIPVVDEEVRQALDNVTDENRAALQEQLKESGKLPQGKLQSGYFLIAEGQVVTGDEDEVPGNEGEPPTTRDQTILDDLIVDGSLCVGDDCVNGESFGFDTIRLKENNLRIKFQDTSSSGSFPSNDWQLTANDSANGGANKFSIDDIDGGRTPLTIEAGAPSHSLYVDDGGRLGFGTSTPVVELHLVDGDTPTLRLQQDGSSGFTPQTWDIAGNEAGFFIRDVTNGSNLSFRIRPGAPASSIDIQANGDVGIGTSSASADLHVYGSDGTTDVIIEEVSSTEANRTVFHTKNNGVTTIKFEDTSADGVTWSFKISPNGFQVKKDTVSVYNIGNDGSLVLQDNSGAEIFHLYANGDLTIAGMLTTAFGANLDANEAKIVELEQKNAELEARIAELERLVNELASK